MTVRHTHWCVNLFMRCRRACEHILAPHWRSLPNGDHLSVWTPHAIRRTVAAAPVSAVTRAGRVGRSVVVLLLAACEWCSAGVDDAWSTQVSLTCQDIRATRAEPRTRQMSQTTGVLD